MKNTIGYIILLAFFISVMVFIGRLTVNSTNEIERDIKNNVNTENLIRSAMEKAYAEGQYDAINGDIRIKSINFGRYVWIKSPWNSKAKPVTDTIKIDKYESY